MIQRWTQADNNKDEGNDDDALSNHGRVLIKLKVTLFSLINASLPIG